MTDGLKDVHREAIIAEIAANDRVERAVLFGSRATGTNTVSSDVDIALFGDRLTLTDQARLAAALDEIPMAQSVDLLLYDSIQDRTLREHIRREGVEWYARPTECLRGEWTQHRLVDLCDITRGASPRPIHDWIATSGIPWVKIADATATASRYIEQTRERIRCEGRSNSVTVFPGDLILSNSASPGIPKFMNIEACIHDGWLLLRNFRGLDRLFTYYLLLYERDALVGKGTGSVFTNLKTEILKQHGVTVPIVGEQQSIAHVLGTLDDKLELNRRMNATLEAMARALFRSWFVDFDPVRAKIEGRDTGLPKDIADLFPDRLVDSELGEMPAGWRVGRVGDGFEITMGQSPPGNTYNDIGDGLPFFQGRSDFGFRYPSNRKFCTAPNRIAQPGDTIVSVRAPVGGINMAWERCCIGRGVAALRHRSGGVSFGYCTAQTLQVHMREYEHAGTVFGAINRKQLSGLPLRQPSADIVRTFERLVHVWDDTIRQRTAQNKTLTALRNALLPKLVSGELRVGDGRRLAANIAPVEDDTGTVPTRYGGAPNEDDPSASGVVT